MEPVKARRKREKGRFPYVCPARRVVADKSRIRGVGMADVIFVALTVAIFVILGLVVRAVERL
jgi:hypothetical protein